MLGGLKDLLHVKHPEWCLTQHNSLFFLFYAAPFFPRGLEAEYWIQIQPPKVNFLILLLSLHPVIRRLVPYLAFTFRFSLLCNSIFTNRLGPLFLKKQKSKDKRGGPHRCLQPPHKWLSLHHQSPSISGWHRGMCSTTSRTEILRFKPQPRHLLHDFGQVKQPFYLWFPDL